MGAAHIRSKTVSETRAMPYALERRKLGIVTGQGIVTHDTYARSDDGDIKNDLI